MIDIVKRATWGAQMSDGFGMRQLPARFAWLHHTAALMPDVEWVDANGDSVDDDEARTMRQLEDIGEQRFGRGVSYTYVVMPSGRVYQGHSLHRRGSHTKGFNTTGIGIAFAGNYQLRHPTPAQRIATARLLVDLEREGVLTKAELSGGHRDAPSARTACPGDLGILGVPTINEIVREFKRGVASQTPQPPTPSIMEGRRVSVHFSPPVLRIGARGHEVRVLQGLLVAHGETLTVDGSFGPVTSRAVMRKQTHWNLKADGVAGPKTWQAAVVM